LELIEEESTQASYRPLTTKEWIGFFAMVVGMFMAVLDIQIVASSIAEIQAGLSATRTEISWIQTAYLIAEVIVIPLSGFLSRVFSTRVLFCASAIGFTIMSALCASASNLPAMIIFRAFQGLLGGAMIPTVFSTIFILIPRNKIATVNTFVGLVVTIAPIAGPTLGGYITQAYSWHWMFLMNVPFGILITLVIWNTLDIDKPDFSLLKKCDWSGLIYMITFLASLEFFLEEGTTEDWFESNLIRMFFCITVTSGILFFRRVLSYHEPIVDLSAFKNKNFALGCIFSFILGMALFGSAFLLPSFLSTIRMLNSLQIGQVMAITGTFQLLSAPVAGFISNKNIDLRIVLCGGLFFFGCGIHLNSYLTVDNDWLQFFIPQMLIGFSIMFCFIPINTLALSTMPKDKIKNASGLYNLMRNLGGALGLAVLGTLLTTRGKMHYQYITETVRNTRLSSKYFLQQLTHYFDYKVNFADKVSLQFLQNLITREATIMAFNDCYYIVSCFLFFAAMATPLMKKAVR
jgi:DHA2 family multidrug resistance protein